MKEITKIKIGKNYLKSVNACQDSIEAIGNKPIKLDKLYCWCLSNGHKDWAVWMLACFKQNEIKLLLEYGANPNMQNYWGRTPLHWACICGNIEIVKLLLNFEADYNIMDHWNKLPEDYTNILEIKNLFKRSKQ